MLEQCINRVHGRVLSLVVAIALFAAAIGGYAIGQRSDRARVAAEEGQSLAALTVDLGGSGQTRPAPTGQVREYDLVARPGKVELVSGVTVDALTYNGQVPGPTIRVTEGDTLRATLRNELDEPTSIHWHGLHVPNAMDGVPGVTQEAVAPGASFTYEFVVSHAGTFMYHSHQNAAEQVDAGLYGVLIVDPQAVEGRAPTVFDAEYTMMLSAWNVAATAPANDPEAMPGMEPSSTPPASDDMERMDQPESMEEMPGMDMGATATPPAGAAMDDMPGMSDDTSTGQADASGESMAMAMDYNYFTVNGKAFPDIPAWEATEGDLIRVRLINISNLVHPMHLHGMDFKVVAKDGEALPAAQQTVMNTVAVNAGETYDIVILADNLGTWVFHCHELHHAENDGVEPGGLIQVLAIKAAD